MLRRPERDETGREEVGAGPERRIGAASLACVGNGGGEEHRVALAAEAGPAMHVAAALATADPLRLDLPPVVSPQVTPEALRSMSGL